MGKIDFLKKFLLPIKGESLEIIKFSGSSLSEVFLCKGIIYKVGPYSEAAREIFTYQKLRKKFSDDNYKKIFPKAELLLKDGDNSVWEIEHAGSKSFEKILLTLDGKNGLKKAEALNMKILSDINLMFDLTFARSSADEASVFLDEIKNAIFVNLQRAGFDRYEIEKIIHKTEAKKEFFCKDFVSSVAHRDLTVGNIIVGDDEKSVKFIDPRSALPNAEHSKAMGNISADLAGYYVSLLRKEMELKKRNRNISLGTLISSVLEEIEKRKKEKVFSPELFDLMICLWYSVYVACRCEYCMAQESKWLYEEMLSMLNSSLKQFD